MTLHFRVMENSFDSKAEQMRQHIQQCSSGNQTVAAYCKDHEIGIATYYYWYKKLNIKHASKPDRFIELPQQPIAVDCIEILFPNGVKLCIDKLVPASYLRELCYI
jgi:hypothetical protein